MACAMRYIVRLATPPAPARATAQRRAKLTGPFLLCHVQPSTSPTCQVIGNRSDVQQATTTRPRTTTRKDDGHEDGREDRDEDGRDGDVHEDGHDGGRDDGDRLIAHLQRMLPHHEGASTELQSMPGHLNQVQIQDLPPAQQLKSSTKIKLIAGTKFTTDCTTMDQLLAKGVAGAALTLLVAAEIEEDMGRNQKERQDDGGGAEMTTVEYVTICVPTRGGGSNVRQMHRDSAVEDKRLWVYRGRLNSISGTRQAKATQYQQSPFGEPFGVIDTSERASSAVGMNLHRELQTSYYEWESDGNNLERAENMATHDGRYPGGRLPQ